jgi:hypothetical protein
LTALFAKPDQNIPLPSSAVARARHIPEIYTNVQGSSAGAGSGEFHVYKASRRREYERLKEMDDSLKREKDQGEFEKSRADKVKRDEDKTRKNRERREKMRARKAKKGDGAGPNGAAAQNLNGGLVAGSSREDRDKEDETTGATTSASHAGLVIHDDD